MLNANGVRTRQYAIAVEHRSDVKSQHDCLDASNAAARRVRKCCVELSLMWFVFERLVGPVHCFLMSGCFRCFLMSGCFRWHGASLDPWRRLRALERFSFRALGS